MPTSHGRNAAFSTGSQAQNPPQPEHLVGPPGAEHDADGEESTANSVHRRVSTCHPSSSRPVMSEAMAKAKGTVKPTKPR